MSDLPDELPSDPAELRAFAAALLDRCARLLPWASIYTMHAHDPRLAA
jgi:hypothetical protein